MSRGLGQRQNQALHTLATLNRQGVYPTRRELRDHIYGAVPRSMGAHYGYDPINRLVRRGLIGERRPDLEHAFKGQLSITPKGWGVLNGKV